MRVKEEVGRDGKRGSETVKDGIGKKTKRKRNT